jgi:hypothetical protein
MAGSWGYDWGMTWAIALVLRPLAALLLFGLICLPARMAVQRWMPAGKVKRLLLLRIRRPWGAQGNA